MTDQHTPTQNVCWWFGTIAECRDKPCKCLERVEFAILAATGEDA